MHNIAFAEERIKIMRIKKFKEQQRKMEIKDLKPVKVVGRGAMGTVFLVHKADYEKPLALKAMSKSAMATKGDGLRRAQIEKDILARLNHPFLPSLVGHVETDKIVGWLVDYCPGGDLNALRHKQTEKMFSESIIRFYAAEIVLALEHLHGQGIVYRDLKPENVLIQANGHIMLTDFDLSTRLSPVRLLQQQQQIPDLAKLELHEMSPKQRCSSRGLDSVVSYFRRATTTKASSSHMLRSSSARVSTAVGRGKKKNHHGTPPNTAATDDAAALAAPVTGRLNSFVGTEEYVSPEVLKRTGHDFPVDWWALGVLLYEMIYGTTPFKGSTRRDTFYNILIKRPQFMGPWNPLSDLIEKLLIKDPHKRLGSFNGAHDVKNHLFFRGLNWEALPYVSRAPFLPPVVPLHPSRSVISIEDCVEDLEADDMEDKLSNHNKHSERNSEDSRDEVSHNWVQRLPKARAGDAFGLF